MVKKAKTNKTTADSAIHPAFVEIAKAMAYAMSARADSSAILHKIAEEVALGCYPAEIEPYAFGKAVDWALKNCPNPYHREDFLKGFNERISE